jgi:hypothetical protein
VAEHRYKTSADCGCAGTSREGRCDICDGGLSICAVCRLFEGCLTTECPGVPAYRDFAAAVYAGEVDFRGGVWAAACSPHCPHAFRTEGVRPS